MFGRCGVSNLEITKSVTAPTTILGFQASKGDSEQAKESLLKCGKNYSRDTSHPYCHGYTLRVLLDLSAHLTPCYFRVLAGQQLRTKIVFSLVHEKRMIRMTSEKMSDSNRSVQYLANERTFLPWLRTSIALIGLGFVVSRFGLFLRELGIAIL